MEYVSLLSIIIHLHLSIQQCNEKLVWSCGVSLTLEMEILLYFEWSVVWIDYSISLKLAMGCFVQTVTNFFLVQI